MKTIEVSGGWKAKYKVERCENVRLVSIESRSAIELVVAKVEKKHPVFGEMMDYYISAVNFGVAIPGIGTLDEDFWISEALTRNGLPKVDAQTVASVLRDMGDF